MKSRTKLWFACVVMLLAAGVTPAVRAADSDSESNRSPAVCGSSDTPEPENSIQGDDPPAGGANCGLSFVSEVPGGGSVQGAGHCGYVRTGDVINVYDLSDPANPQLVGAPWGPLATHGSSESMRAQVADDRAILVSGSGLWDISNCAQPVFKGEIPWPSLNATAGAYIAATNSHEIGISHDAKRVYSGLGFAIAFVDDLDHRENWTVKNYTCEMNRQSGFPVAGLPEATASPCDIADEGDYPRQYSHSSDDNLEGTRWYGANQNGDGVSQLEPSTMRVVDISDPDDIKILYELSEVPGHSMNWFRIGGERPGPGRGRRRGPGGAAPLSPVREFTVSANESLTGGDRCGPDPRPTGLGNALQAYVTEVTGDELRPASVLRLKINDPATCEDQPSGASPVITEHSVYNKHGAAMVMLEYGSAGLRVFDLRDPSHPKEAAYFNHGGGMVHSGVFHYDDARGIMLQSASRGMVVLELQPQVIAALGLPYPTDPAYPRYPNGRPVRTGAAAAPQNMATEQESSEILHQHEGHEVTPLQ